MLSLCAKRALSEITFVRSCALSPDNGERSFSEKTMMNFTQRASSKPVLVLIQKLKI